MEWEEEGLTGVDKRMVETGVLKEDGLRELKARQRVVKRRKEEQRVMGKERF